MGSRKQELDNGLSNGCLEQRNLATRGVSVRGDHHLPHPSNLCEGEEGKSRKVPKWIALYRTLAITAGISPVSARRVWVEIPDEPTQFYGGAR